MMEELLITLGYKKYTINNINNTIAVSYIGTKKHSHNTKINYFHNTISFIYQIDDKFIIEFSDNIITLNSISELIKYLQWSPTVNQICNHGIFLHMDENYYIIIKRFIIIEKSDSTYQIPFIVMANTVDKIYYMFYENNGNAYPKFSIYKINNNYTLEKYPDDKSKKTGTFTNIIKLIIDIYPDITKYVRDIKIKHLLNE